MPPQAISAQGTLVAIDRGNTGTFVTIAELRNITPWPVSRNPIETTSHNEAEESFVMGIRRKGEMQITIGYVPSLGTHDHLTGLMKSIIDGSLDRYRVTYPNGSVWLTSGYTQNIGPTAPVDGGLEATITIRPTGTMSFA
jgi:hypothetical protein